MNKNSKKTIFVAMSGGVDSSVAALLLKRQNYNVIGVFMRCWSGPDASGVGVNCAEKDAEDARRVAEKLNIPFYVWDFENEYKKKVVEYMIKGYKKGITPNPDVMCNREIKFGLFLKKALEMGADYVATGHYVRLSRIAFRKQHNFLPARKFASLSLRHSSLRSETKLAELRDVPQDNSTSSLFSLFIAKDKNKDQSYFLWTLTQKQLKYCLFPIGDYLKSEVRKIAQKAGLSTAEKKDSQGICFLGKINLDDFLKKYIPEKRGDILLAISDAKGNVSYKKIGKHKGAYFYTIGQRHINANFQFPISKKNRKPYYVVEKNVKKNIIVVAEGDDNSALYKKEIKLTDVNFINQDFHSLICANKGISILTRVRYRQPLISAQFIIYNSKFIIQFDQLVKYVAPGQSAVFYLPAKEQKAKAGNKKSPAVAKAMAGEEMLGGGVIL